MNNKIHEHVGFMNDIKNYDMVDYVDISRQEKAC